MRLFGKKPNKETVWTLVIVSMVFVLALWIFIFRNQMTNLQGGQGEGLFQSIKKAIDDKKIDENIDQIKEAWTKRDEANDFEEGFENKIETSEDKNDSNELNDEEVRQIKQKIEQYQNKAE